MTSLEFRPLTSFTSPLFPESKSSRKGARDGEVSASSFLFVCQRSLLFLGLSDGKILCWDVDKNCVDVRGKDSKARVLAEHKGSVCCLHFTSSMCQGVLFSGSADRTIRMWDLSDPRLGIQCVQIMHGHGGTVLALEYGLDLLLSSSSDGFLCIWRDQSPAKLLRFPALSAAQRISTDTKCQQTGSRGLKETWFLSLAIRDGEALSIIAGDSEGYVHILRPDPDTIGEHYFVLSWKGKVHELGVVKVLAVPMESFIVTLSFDQTFKVLDSLTGLVTFTMTNPCNAMYLGLAYDPQGQDIIVGDEKGNLAFYNIYTESCVALRSLGNEPILKVCYESGSKRLLVLNPHSLRVIEVVRGVKFTELSEHTGPIVSMTSRTLSHGGLLYTASMDNTIRMWDTDSLECLKCIREKKQEITAMVFLPRANVIVTGHENAELKIWSLECPQEALLTMVGGHQAHSNTISALAYVTSSAQEDSSPTSSPTTSYPDEELSSGFEAVVAGSYDRQLSYWKVTVSGDGTALAKFERLFLAHQEPEDEILAVAYSPSANSVFTGGNAGIIRKWSFSGLAHLEVEYQGHEDGILCFSVDANFLYSGSVDQTIRIWETSQGFQLKVVKVHDVTVQSILVLPESGCVASCGHDGKLRLWDPLIGKTEDVSIIHTYEHPEEFRALTYVQLSQTILVGAESGKIISFPLPGASADAVPSAFKAMQTPPSTRGDGAQPWS